MENMDSQFCEPDTTTANIDVVQPPPLTPLQIVQQLYRDQRAWCSEMLQGCARARRQAQEQLTEAWGRRESSKSNLQSVKKRRKVISKAVTKTKLLLDRTNAKCSALQKDLHAKLNWRPANDITEQEQRALKKRVQFMRSLLNTDIQQRGGP